VNDQSISEGKGIEETRFEGYLSSAVTGETLKGGLMPTMFRPVLNAIVGHIEVDQRQHLIGAEE
jgi:hypothetical protein